MRCALLEPLSGSAREPHSLAIPSSHLGVVWWASSCFATWLLGSDRESSRLLSRGSLVSSVLHAGLLESGNLSCLLAPLLTDGLEVGELLSPIFVKANLLNGLFDSMPLVGVLDLGIYFETWYLVFSCVSTTCLRLLLLPALGDGVPACDDLTVLLFSTRLGLDQMSVASLNASLVV